VASGTVMGASAVLFYVVAYTLMTLGAFAVLTALGRDGERDVLIDDVSGLAQHRPWLAFATAVFMLALLGFPGTAGFIGKWLILGAAVDAHQYRLAVLLVVASVISAGYYLPVIMAMYMKPPAFDGAHESVSLPRAARWVVAVAALLLLLLGVWPGPTLDLARSSGAALRSTMVNVIH
jgi:NADH-quinone oxidoreductase subunit N